MLPTVLFAQIQVVKQTTGSKANFPLVTKNSLSFIYVDSNDFEVVKKSAGLFASDVERVTSQTPKTVSNSNELKDYVVIIGTIGSSDLLNKLVTLKKLRIDNVKNGWERFLIQTINNPFPNVKQALVIAGSDRRGTAYGVFSVSQAIGVSPWYWWADVPVAKSNDLFIKPINYTSKSPGVKYRGIFINDEDWGINQWARKTFEKEFGSGVGPKTYEKVFELMLRLRLNYIWPAMHEVSKEFGDTPENVELADRYGIVAGSSHCEPMLYNNVHWNERQRGNWNYSINRDTIYNVWKQTAMARGDKEAVWTTGIRGIHDRGMETPPTTIPERINVVEKVFKEQRELIGQYVTGKWGPVAQCFVPYKEVLPIYDAGLKVPDDVTLIWVDDNFGYIRRLSNPTERIRSGGSGLYWHLSYYGGPHSYTWLNTTAPALMWEEFHKAWENGARTMWVINVGDIKPMELGIDYFSRLAWNPETQGTDAQAEFLKSFLSENFGNSLITPLTQLVDEYFHLGTVRKPELMNRAWALSLSDKSAAQLKSEYERLLKMESSVAGKMPVVYRGAYAELIGIPSKILAASGLIFMHDRDIIYGADSLVKKPEIDRLRTFIDDEVENYNNIGEGKWKFMMPGAVTARNLTAWNSQVAWPWGELAKPDTSKKAIEPNVIRLASSADRKTSVGIAKWTLVPGLGASGQAMALKPVDIKSVWDATNATAPTLEYNFKSDGKGCKVVIDFLPAFRTYPGMQLRVAVGVDDKLISTVEVPGSDGKEDENGPNRNQGIRNNYVRATIDLAGLEAGSHRLFIRAVDPGAVIDKVSFLTSEAKR
jgi:hypothetical protein